MAVAEKNKGKLTPLPDSYWEKVVMKEIEIKVGFICKVENPVLIHCNISKKFVTNAGHADIATKKYVTVENYLAPLNENVRVLYIGVRDINPNITIAIVETVDSLKYLKFAISIKGLTYEGLSELFLESYLIGTVLDEMVPDNYVNEVLIEAIALRNPMDIEFVNADLLSDGDYKQILCRDGGLLGLVPEDRRNLELCQVAVEEEPYAETFVPERLKSLVKY